MFCSPCFSQFSAHTFKKNARRIKKAQDVIFAVISQCQHNLLACTKSEHIAPLFSTLRRCLTTQIRMLLLCCLTLQTQKAKRENIYTHTWVYTLPSALTTASTKRCFFYWASPRARQEDFSTKYPTSQIWTRVAHVA